MIELKSSSLIAISSEDFVIWITDVSNRPIQLYMCERCENRLWLLNKRYLQISSLITELETNIQHYFILYKYINSDNDNPKLILSKIDQK